MAIFVGAKLITGSSGTLPPVLAGDLAVIMAVKWSSSSPTPTVPSGWTSLSSSTTTYRRVLGYRVVANSSSGASTSNWTGADALYVAVYRGVSIGASASNASTSNGAGAPALTLTSPGTSMVMVMGSSNGTAPTLPAGTVERLRGSGSGANDLYADTGLSTPVSSWTAKTGNFAVVAAVELALLSMRLDAVALTTSWQVNVRRTGPLLATSWQVNLRRLTGPLLTTRWRVFSRRTGSLLATGWKVNTHGDWRALTSTAAYRTALTSRVRIVGARAELVDYAGNPRQYLTSAGTPLRVNLKGTVEYNSEVAESWALTGATVSGDDWVPNGPDHPLDQRSGYAIRIWWRLQVAGVWIDLPVGTFQPDSPQVTDDGTITVSFTGRDMLFVAKSSGYAGQTIDVGGLTVDQGLLKLFAIVAPDMKIKCSTTDITLPSPYVLGKGVAEDDWKAMAEVAGWTVRTDREGSLVIGEPPTAGAPVRSFQEGQDCAITVLTRDISSVTYNQVLVLGTNSSVDPPVWGLKADTDPGSPTWVGLGRVRQLRIESDVPTTTKACENMAAMFLGKYLRPSEAFTLKIPPDPTLNAEDVLLIARPRAGVGGAGRVSKWSFPLPDGDDPGEMTVTTVREQASL